MYLIAGIQMQKGIVAGDFVPTAGATYHAPRITHDADGNVLGYLHEPQATNLDADSFDWFGVGSSGGSVSNTGTAVSPSGATDAEELTIANASNNRGKTVTVVAETDYVFSFWVKKGTATDLKYSVYDISNASDIVARTSYFSQLSSGDWERIQVAFTTPSGCVSIKCYVTRDSSVGTLFTWGAQLELGTAATSLIPTYGAEATRQADTTTAPEMLTILAGWPDVTFYGEGTLLNGPVAAEFLTVKSNDADRAQLGITELVNAGLRSYFFSSAGGSANLTPGSIVSGDDFKFAVTVAPDDINASLDGGAVESDTSIERIAVDPTQASLGRHGGYIYKRIRIYKGRLPDAKLITLTTP